jgi:large subunit ribosomal protein L22
MKKLATAKLRYLRMAPRKARLLIDVIRGMKADQALVQLQFSTRHASLPIQKLLASAVANAEHNANIDPQTLVIKTAFVDGGPILYRSMPRAQGRATPIRKRTCHITLILEGDVNETVKKEKVVEAVEEKEVKTKKKTVKKTSK